MDIDEKLYLSHCDFVNSVDNLNISSKNYFEYTYNLKEGYELKRIPSTR
jgi:hypothetical protein